MGDDQEDISMDRAVRLAALRQYFSPERLYVEQPARALLGFMLDEATWNPSIRAAAISSAGVVLIHDGFLPRAACTVEALQTSLRILAQRAELGDEDANFFFSIPDTWPSVG